MVKHTPEGEALTELILEVFRFNGELLDAGNRLTEPHGLTSARWQVMGAIDLAGVPLTVAQIARRMGLARQGVQRIANDLRKQNFLEFEPNIDHKRSPHLSLSKKGSKALKAIKNEQALWVNQLADGLSERRLKSAVKILQAAREKSVNTNHTKRMGTK